MNNDLKILVKAVFDDSQKSINELNNQLKQLQNKIDQLELKIHIDEKAIKTINDFSKAMDNHKQITQDLNKIIREEKTITKEADGRIKEKIKQHLKSGEIIEKEIEKINKKNKAIKSEKEEIGKLITEYERLGNIQKRISRENAKGEYTGGSEKYKNGFTDTTYRLNKKGEVTSVTITENFDQQQKATQKLNESMEKLRQKVLQLNNAGTITSASLGRITTAINGAKTEAELKRIEQALTRVQNSSKAREQMRNLEHQLDLFRRQAQVNAQNILRTHGGFVDNQAMQNYLNSVNALTTKTPNLAREMKNLNMQFREISTNAKSAAGAAQQAGMSFAEMMSTAMVKFPIWMISATVFYAPIRAMEDIISRLVEIDTLLVDINRAMDIPDFKLTELLNEAVNVSDQLSSKLTDVLKIIGEFGRMGFEENQLIDIAKTAQVLQNISDLDATAAVDTLTSAMLNFNIAAEDSIKIADQLNEVDLFTSPLYQ